MAVLFTIASSFAASATPAAADAPLAWDWSRSHRYYIETHVALPTWVWLGTPFNRQARTTGFELRLVTTCGDAEVERSKVAEVNCPIEDVSLSARGLPQEEGLLQPILEELDAALTGSVVQLQIHADGRLVNVDLEDALDRRNRRSGRINETLRLVVSRAFAGLDLVVPEGDEDTWVQYRSWLMRAPSSAGSSGGLELVNRKIDQTGAYVLVQSAGRGLIVPNSEIDRYDARMTSETWFDVATGRMTDRTWTVIAGPTASSFIAQGAAGYPYTQRGRLVALTEGQKWDVGESRELPAGEGPSAIQGGSGYGGSL